SVRSACPRGGDHPGAQVRRPVRPGAPPHLFRVAPAGLAGAADDGVAPAVCRAVDGLPRRGGAVRGTITRARGRPGLRRGSCPRAVEDVVRGVLRLRGCGPARPQGCEATRRRGYKAARLRGGEGPLLEKYRRLVGRDLEPAAA